MREQGLFIFNLMDDGNLLPLQLIQTKAFHFCDTQSMWRCRKKANITIVLFFEQTAE